MDLRGVNHIAFLTSDLERLSRFERPMFQRGRIDPFALNVADAEIFDRLRSDLIDRGASDGIVTDFGIRAF